MFSIPEDNADINLLGDVFSRLKMEFVAQAEKNNRALEALKLSEYMLPEKSRELLEDGAKCCHILGLEDIDQCKLSLKYAELVLDKARNRELSRKGKQNGRKIKKVLSYLQEQNSVLDSEIRNSTKDLKRLEIDRRTSGKILFYKEKNKDYETKAKEIEEIFSPSEPRIKISTVSDDHVHLSSINEEIKALKLELLKHKKLPPDMKLAKEKLREAKIELENVQLEVNQAIEIFAKTL